jgi:hypothetical protein
VNRSVVIDPPDGRIPFQPWALKVRDAREEVHNDHARLTSKNLDGRAKCYLAGVPRIITGAGLMNITRFPDRVTMHAEFTHQYGVIYITSKRARESTNRASFVPRIDQHHAGRREVRGVPGHAVQPVAHRRRGDQAVDGGNRLGSFLRGRSQLSP